MEKSLTGTEFTPEELQTMLAQMERASAAFYTTAIRIHAHGFLEFAGLMNQYVEVCRTALREGKDFSNANVHGSTVLPLADHQAAYLGEKFACIFGPSFRNNPQLWEVFQTQVLGAKDEDDFPDPRPAFDHVVTEGAHAF